MSIWGIVGLIILSPLILICAFLSVMFVYGIIYALVSYIIGCINKITNKE